MLILSGKLVSDVRKDRCAENNDWTEFFERPSGRAHRSCAIQLLLDDREGDGVATMEEFRTICDWFIIWQSDYEANGDHIAKAYLALESKKKKKKRKTAYHKWNSETMEGFVLSSKTWIIRECFLCETFLNNKRQKCLGIQSMIKYPESLHSQLENVSRWLISGRKRLLNFHISTCFH